MANDKEKDKDKEIIRKPKDFIPPTFCINYPLSIFFVVVGFINHPSYFANTTIKFNADFGNFP